MCVKNTAMKITYLISVFIFIPLIHCCSVEKDPVTPDNILIVKTIDGFGRPVPSTIVYESRDCEYDFSLPVKLASNKEGITVLTIPPGYLQLFAEGFVHESYRCMVYSGKTETITLYADTLPTFIRTKPNSLVTYFPNKSGDCTYEWVMGKQVRSDSSGKAILYLPFQDTYKIQSNGMVQCFQPDQEVHTLVFE